MLHLNIKLKQSNIMKTSNITTKEFHDYLISLGLFRIFIKEDENSFYAGLALNCNANVKDFTQVTADEDGYPVVRLSKSDINNDAITKGFFK